MKNIIKQGMVENKNPAIKEVDEFNYTCLSPPQEILT